MSNKAKHPDLKLVHVTAPVSFEFEPTEWDAAENGYPSPEAAATLGMGPHKDMLIEVAIAMASARRHASSASIAHSRPTRCPRPQRSWGALSD